MSLFLKIFLWFWLAIALIVAALVLVNWSTQSEPLTRQWQTFIGEAVSINSQTAVQIYKNEGRRGLDEYLNRVASAERVIAIGLFNANRTQIGGAEVSAEAAATLEKAFNSETVEFDRLPEQTIAAKKVSLSDGSTYFYLIQLKRPPRTPLLTEIWKRILQILAVILTGGLVGYGLAR